MNSADPQRLSRGGPKKKSTSMFSRRCQISPCRNM